MENVIEIKDVSFSYKSNISGENVKAIDGVSLDVKEGEFVCILGANGSGKSTLAKLINAQLTPQEGEIRVEGMSTIDEDKIWEIRRECGMVFQNPDNQIVTTIVEEDVAFGPENLGLPSEEIRKRVDMALEIVGMTKFKDHSPTLLSGGQKQRVAIAGILALMPDIIIFDEPTAMLDPGGRKDVLDTILKLNREENKTILLITHFMEEAIYADRIFIFEDGKIAEVGTPKEIFKDPKKVRSYGLDAPFAPEMEYLLGDKAMGCDSLELHEYTDCTIAKLQALNVPKSQAPDEEKTQPVEPVDNDDAIVIKSLSHVYSPGTPFEFKALEGISMSIKKGDFVGVIGHTGSGKSTFIQHLNALMFPTEGEIFVEGEKISKDMDLIKLRQKVGMVFQYPEHQLFEETCFKDVAFGPKNLGLDDAEIEKRVKESLEAVGLDYEWVKDRSPFDLSGGQKRRVAIAGVLAMKPSYLILDEPTAGLDPMGRDEIIDEIKEIADREGLTVIYVTHSMDDIAAIADKILVLDHGKLKYYTIPERVFANEEDLVQIGLDLPSVVTYRNALCRAGYGMGQVLVPEEAAAYLKEIL